MGEMPKLTNTDPWQLQEAFAQQALRNDLLEQRANAYGNRRGAGNSTASDDQAQDDAQDATTIPSNADPASMPQTAMTPLITKAALANGVQPPLFARLVQAESSGNPNATSPVGAKGLTQLMPGTAKDMGVNDIGDPSQQLNAGAKYLGQMKTKYNGNDSLALAAYNWGPGNVDKWIASGADPSKMPAGVHAYVKKINGTDVKAQNDPSGADAGQQVADDTVDPMSRLSWLS